MYNRQENPVDFTTTMRPDDPSTFIGTDATGKTVRFETRISSDLGKPKSLTFRYQRRIPELRPEEAPGAGGAWGGPGDGVTKPMDYTMSASSEPFDFTRPRWRSVPAAAAAAALASSGSKEAIAKET